MKKIYRDLIILLGIGLGIWLGLSWFLGDSKIDESDMKLDNNTIELSELYHDLILEEYDLLESNEIKNAIATITFRLEENIDSKKHNYTVYILNSDEINAFTTTDGKIYIFKGLLNEVKDAEMLAAVIAHEMGHNENNHFYNRIKRELGINAAITILTGGDPSLISEISGSLFSLNFDREEELEADDFASSLLLESNLKPSHLTRFFINQPKDSNLAFSDFTILSTHPHTLDRIEESLNTKVSDDFNEIPINVDWEKVTETLKELKK